MSLTVCNMSSRIGCSMIRILCLRGMRVGFYFFTFKNIMVHILVNVKKKNGFPSVFHIKS